MRPIVHAPQTTSSPIANAFGLHRALRHREALQALNSFQRLHVGHQGRELIRIQIHFRHMAAWLLSLRIFEPTTHMFWSVVECTCSQRAPTSNVREVWPNRGRSIST